MPERNWLTCYMRGHDKGRCCLYAEASLARLRSDPPRCVKHGYILEWASELRGMSRDQARAYLDKPREEDC
jgi:hypothetical protein